MKKLICLILAAVMLLSMPVYAENENVEISFKVGDSMLTINGEKIEVEKPYVVGAGTTLVPIRVISEAFGAAVGWVEESETVTVDYEDIGIVLQIGNKTASVNGTPAELAEAPQLTDRGFTMIPLRFISETFGADVSYDDAAEEITVSKKAASEPTVTVSPVPTAAASPTPTAAAASAPAPNADIPKISEADKAAINDIYYDIRYDFEQRSLPGCIYDETEEKDINDQNDFSQLIYKAWRVTAYADVISLLVDSDTDYAFDNNEDLNVFLENAVNECGLAPEENITKIDYVDGNNGDKIAIITMKDYNELLMCKYIGIRYNKVGGFTVYTLETSFDGAYAFCAVFPDSRGNFGFIKPDYDTFVQAVKNGKI